MLVVIDLQVFQKWSDRPRERMAVNVLQSQGVVQSRGKSVDLNVLIQGRKVVKLWIAQQVVKAPRVNCAHTHRSWVFVRCEFSEKKVNPSKQFLSGLLGKRKGNDTFGRSTPQNLIG